MGKPITEEHKKAFLIHCLECVRDGEGYLTIESLPAIFKETGTDGEPLWDFHAANYNPDTSHDFYELFESVKDQYEFEEEGHDSFFVYPAE